MNMDELVKRINELARIAKERTLRSIARLAAMLM